MMKAALRTLRNRTAAILVVTTLLVPMAALPAYAADDATLTVSPTEVAAGSIDNTFTLTFTSLNSALSGNSRLEVRMHEDFGTPQTGDPNGPNYLKAQNVDCQQGPSDPPDIIGPPDPYWLIGVDLQCYENSSFILTLTNVTAPSTSAIPYVMSTSVIHQSGGMSVSRPFPSILVDDAPGKPTLDSAVGGDGVVDLEWSAPSTGTVTGYQVQRSLTTGTGFADVGSELSTLATTDNDALLVNGTEYFYRVLALNGGLASDPSNELSATPNDPPDAPTLTSATGGNRRVTLEWDPPAGGALPTGYRIERAPDVAGVAGTFATAVTVGNVTTTVDTGLTNGDTYWYQVRALNGTSAGPASSPELSATPRAPRRSSPGGSSPSPTPSPVPTTVPSPEPTIIPAPGRCVDEAPPSNFRDVTPGQVHEREIDCISWKNITVGNGPGTYGPGWSTTRAQMASFLVRTVREAGVSLPGGRDQFTDDQGSVHHAAINQLAAAGIVRGTSPRTFDPNAPVRRDQMATMLVNTYAWIRDEQMAPGSDHFGDDNGNIHEDNINIAADRGLALGHSSSQYSPGAGTRRDQMASFLTRLLELLG